MHFVARRIEEAWLGRGMLSTLLLPLSWLYRAIINIRRLCHRFGLLRTERLDVPVLIVGNLIVGGAGKTPTVVACVAILRSFGYRPGVISRGYRPRGAAGSGREPASNPALPVDVTPTSSPQTVGDEPLLLRLRTRVPVVVGADRVAAGRALRAAHPEVDIIVSDDGLQHLRLGRDAAVVVFDERGTGNGRLLPAGPLREPLTVLDSNGRRAAGLGPRTSKTPAIVLYNAAAPSTTLEGFLARPILVGAIALADWWSASTEPNLESLHALRGRKVTAVAGVARPERFFSMLEAQGLDIDRIALPDHFDFATAAWPREAHDVLVTEKDAVKLDPKQVGSTRVWVVALDFRPDAAFASALQTLFPGPATR